MEWKGFIPLSRWGELEVKIAKLNKRAVKIGVSPLTLTKTGESYKDESDFPYVCTYIEIILQGETPKMAGWKLLAVLQHDPNLDANVIRTVPGETIPEDYRTRPGVCDHCGYSRIRKETFVVQAVSGELKQVGRQCVADFLGHGDPRRFIKTWEYFEDAHGWCEFGWGGGIRDERQPYSLLAFLAMTNAVITKVGWVSGKKAYEEGITSTAAEVTYQLTPSVRVKLRPEEKVTVTEQDNEYAKKVLAWVLTINPKDDYEHNLLTIAKQEAVIRKTEGYAASMIMAYKRVHDVYEKKVKKVSNYFGKPGDKVNLVLEFKATYSFDSSWGAVHLHRFIDNETGNVFIWQGSTFLYLDEGATYKVKGTIKKHKDYADIKQTILTRCKVEKVEK